MTRLTYPQEKNKQTMPSSDANSHEAEQILYLKRLLVTLKQQFEKNLYELNEELHSEQSRNQALQKELDLTKSELNDLNSHHDQELKALRDQLLTLRDLLKKTQEESQSKNTAEPQADQNELLIRELEKKQDKIAELEASLDLARAESKKEIEQLKQTLAVLEEQGADQELITSNTSSYQLRQELEIIKQTLIQGSQESKTLEKRYADMFDEKIRLEHQLKQLQHLCEEQSSQLNELKDQTKELAELKQSNQAFLQETEQSRFEEEKIRAELLARVQILEEKGRAHDALQEKYEQLKEEYLQLTNNLDEIINLRQLAEKQLAHLDKLCKEQESQLIEKNHELEILNQEREHLQSDIQHLHELLGDTESRLKVAQQHLAKKVKEYALLAEKMDEQQNSLAEYSQSSEISKTQINQLQTSLDLYQKQEKKLQEQLHEALKGTENQVAKWEKKYFEMYDKWQESENQIRELKKFEEKHLQMQNLLANLGNYVGSAPVQHPPFHPLAVAPEPKPSRLSEPVMHAENESNGHAYEKSESAEEKYDLFGMRHPQDKLKPNLFL